MPFLDVSDIVVDPDLSDLFTVTRRSQAIDPTSGRSYTVPEVFEEVPGVVTMQDPAELMRRDDSDSEPRLIFVASTFQFRGVSKEGEQQYKGDVITWPPAGEPGSTNYTVIKVYPYSRYGQGISEIVAESMNATDEAF